VARDLSAAVITCHVFGGCGGYHFVRVGLAWRARYGLNLAAFLVAYGGVQSSVAGLLRLACCTSWPVPDGVTAGFLFRSSYISAGYTACGGHKIILSCCMTTYG